MTDEKSPSMPRFVKLNICDYCNRFLNEMPDDESDVDVLLDDGSVITAHFAKNIMDAGDYDFSIGGAEDAESVADRVVGWRYPE